MSSIRVIQGDFEKKLKLQFAPGIKAGFPSPAEDYSHETLDFNREHKKNRPFRVRIYHQADISYKRNKISP